jgi:hypothetical protein
MEQERELDRLLSQWLTGRRVSAPERLAPLVAAADAMTPLRQATPSAAFARQLEGSVLRRARQLSADSQLSEYEAQAEAQAEAPERSAPRSDSQSATARARRLPRASRLLWTSVIAATLLCMISGVFIAAADAQPGGALYVVRRLEQNVRAQLTTNAADRTRLHLDNAEAALQAFDAAVAQHAQGARLTDALDTFVAEHSAAGTSLSAVTDTATHARLAATLEEQRLRATSDLRAALPVQGWPMRVTVTQALGAIGAVVPLITQVTLSEAGDPADSRGIGRITLVTVSGSGFQPGAQLLLKGAPTGTVLSVSGDTLVAQVRAAAQAVASQGPIGVGNPDGMAAQSKKAPSIISSGRPDPTPSADPTKSGGDNGKHKGTPTP